MEGECGIVAIIEENLIEIVPKIEDLCKIMPKCEEYTFVVEPKEVDLNEKGLKNAEDRRIAEFEEVPWETVTVYEEELLCETVSKNEKDLCDSTVPKGLEVKSSSLSGVAMGVITLEPIENNFQFGPYVGERLELDEEEHAFKSKHCWLVSNS